MERARRARGADGVELDVHRTADGALVVRHDAETPVGPLARADPAELAGALPEVPTLAEVLDVCRGRLVNVEIKDPRPAGRPDALVAARSPARGAAPTTCWCRRSTSPTVDRVRDARARPPDRPSCRSGSIRSRRSSPRSSTGTPRCTPTCGRSLSGDAEAFVAERAHERRHAGQRLDRERRRAARCASRDAGVDARHHRRPRRSPASVLRWRRSDERERSRARSATSSRSTSPR